METINSVNVTSIDEERLKFRVLCGFDCGAGNAVPQRFGSYILELPPLTAFGNSNHYNQCTINLDGISCTSKPAAGEQVSWSNGVAQGKVSALEVSLDTPSSGTLVNKQLTLAEAGTGKNNIGRFNQMVLLQLNKVGKADGTTQSLVAGNDVGTGASAWQGVGLGDAIMCANPFGRQVEINFRRSDLQDKLALAQFGFPAVDVGIYSLQFTITMVPNN
jgi:hypothetical protein